MEDKRTYRIAMSERRFRFKPEALALHAPRRPGVYEFVVFDPRLRPIVLFVGVAQSGTVYDALAAHLMGTARPTADDISRVSRDVYFDFVAEADTAGPEDLRDIAAVLAARHRPRLNAPGSPAPSGRWREVYLNETIVP